MGIRTRLTKSITRAPHSWRTRIRDRGRVLAIIFAGSLLPACAADLPPRRERLVLASTTSTEDSGLFDVLIPAFEAEHPGLDIVVVAVGTGEALELGRRGDADLLLTHHPPAESAFVAEGHGTERREVMYNDFVIVGPPADPAGVRGLPDAGEALRQIARSKSPFVSRGDQSGTHLKELALWEAVATTPSGSWYLEAGQGMGEVLRIASERGGYTLADRSTYLFLRDRLSLEILVEGDERLRNPYAVIPVTGNRNVEGARRFIEWITGPEGQAVIGEYGVDRFGKAIFVPSAADY